MSHYQKFTPPFPIPDSWQWVKLEEIGTWQSGATPSKSQPKYYGKGYPWLNTGDLNDGVITNIPKQITELALKETSVKLNPAGSVLIAMYGATIGKLGILSFSATTNQACCACVHPTINSKYLFFFLLAWRQQFISMGGGGAQPNISKEKIESTFLPVPPLSEQERIVGSIEKYFDLIDNLNTNCNNLDTTITLAKSKILELAMQGKLVPQDPADEPAANMLRRVNPKARIITDNPHSRNLPLTWIYCKLGELSDISRGGSPRPIKSFLTEDPKGINWIKIGDAVGKYINSTEQRIIPSGVSKSRMVHKGDFLLTNSMSFGKPYILNIDGCIHDGWLVISPFNDVYNKDFLYLLLSSPIAYAQFKELAGGAVVSNLNSEKVASACFPVPPFSEQKRIVNKVEELYSVLDEIEASLQS